MNPALPNITHCIVDTSEGNSLVRIKFNYDIRMKGKAG